MVTSLSGSGMHFDYVLYEAGWAEARITTPHRTFRITASYLHDSLRDLVNAVLQLHAGEVRATAVFMDEPGEHHLLFTRRDREEIAVEVRWFTEWASWDMVSPDAYQKLLEATISLSELTAQVIQALNTLLEAFGEEGYRSMWIEHAFPMREFNRLQRIARRGATATL